VAPKLTGLEIQVETFETSKIEVTKPCALLHRQLLLTRNSLGCHFRSRNFVTGIIEQSLSGIECSICSVLSDIVIIFSNTVVFRCDLISRATVRSLSGIFVSDLLTRHAIPGDTLAGASQSERGSVVGELW